MPKFFFDLVDDKTIFDKKGVSLPNEKEARRYAITFARELMQTQPELLGESWQKWSVQVSNGKFDRIMKVPVVDADERKSGCSARGMGISLSLGAAAQGIVVRAIELEQVERDQDRVAFSSLPVAQPVEYGEPIFVAGDDLAIDDDVMTAGALDRLDHFGIGVVEQLLVA